MATSPRPGSLSNIEARQWYLKQLDQLSNKVPANLTKEQEARFRIDLRNRLKRQARDLMADRAAADELDSTDPILDVEYYIDNGKKQGYTDDTLWDYLIGSSQRSRAEVNKSLGLGKNNSKKLDPGYKKS